MELSEENLRVMLARNDSFAAIEWIQSGGTPLDVAGRYQTLVSKLYWKAHDLRSLILVGRAGIHYCLGQSLAGGTPELVTKLRSFAKSLAYDLGSFTWPGWEEPGIHPTAEDLAFGRDCAAMNLRLAVELKKPPERLSMAHWLIGAHALAIAEFAAALQSFLAAQDVLSPDDPAARSLAPCNLGYIAVSRLCLNAQDAGVKAQFDDIITHLRASSEPDAKIYLVQLLAAHRLFIPAA